MLGTSVGYKRYEKGYYSLRSLKIPNFNVKSVGYKRYGERGKWVQAHAAAKKRIQQCDETKNGVLVPKNT